MNLYSKATIQKLLKKFQITPKKSLGQNFFISKRGAQKVIQAAELNSSDIVVEIGPGIGALTKLIAPKVGKVAAIEKDSPMIKILDHTLGEFHNIEIINQDILEFSPRAHNLKPHRYKIVSNLPYQLTSPVLKKFLQSSKVGPKLIVLAIQKEVAQRICGKPPKMGRLSVFVQYWGNPKIKGYLSKTNFWPRSKVDSAILKISNISASSNLQFEQKLFKIVKAGFSQPRKQLINSLSSGLNLGREETKSWLKKGGVDSTRRAQSLNVEDWINLAKSFKILK